MMDKFVLPNENTESVGSAKIMKYHLKSNYVATCKPLFGYHLLHLILLTKMAIQLKLHIQHHQKH